MDNPKCPVCGGEMMRLEMAHGTRYYACGNGACQMTGPNDDHYGDKVRRLHLLQDGEVVMKHEGPMEDFAAFVENLKVEGTVIRQWPEEGGKQ